MPLAFHHLAVRVRDLEGCERFYREVLGLPVVERWPGEDGRDRSVWLGVESGFLALERLAAAPEAAPGGEAGLHLLALRIPARERAAWEARLAARGVAVTRRTRWTLYLEDPEGNRIGLSHHPDEAA